MDRPLIEIRRVNSSKVPRFDLPGYATPGSAGLDLRACIDAPISVSPGETVLVPSGIAINIKNASIMAMITPRSGLGNQGFVLGKLTGIIDSDYQGEVKISVWNRTTNKTFEIEPGQRICQMIFVPVYRVDLKEVDEFTSNTKRASGGFGHSGSF